MKFIKKTNMASLIALLLIITAATPLISPVNAQAVNTYISYVYVSTSADLVGIGQQVLLVMWTADMPPDIGEAVGAAPGGRAAWYDIKIVVTKPDGVNETYTIERTDPVGGGYVQYTPDKAGNYSFQAFFSGTWKNSTTSSTRAFYTSASSLVKTFTVQEQAIPPFPESPLPESYWTRPINSASRNWFVLAGNWLGGAANVWPTGGAGGTTGSYAYGLAPESAHILWTNQFAIGGIMDERYDNVGYQTTHYQGLGFSPIILNGVIHYTPRYTAHWSRGWAGLDLYTGEQLFLNYSITAPAFGSIYNYESPNQHGGFAYLWRTSGVVLPSNITRIAYPGNVIETIQITSQPGTQTWEMLDALTGNRVCYIANVSGTGTAVYGKDGSILRYNIVNLGTTSAPNYKLQVWNSSAIKSMLAGDDSTYYWQWRPQYGGHSDYGFRWRENLDAIHDGSKGYSLNVSIPSVLGPRNAILNQTGSIQTIRQDDQIIIGTSGRNDERGVVQGYLMCLSLEPGLEGTKLWDTTFTPPFASQLGNVTVSMTGVYPDQDVFLFNSAKLLKRWGYDLRSGQQLWESEPEPQLHYYSMTAATYQDQLLSLGGYGGELISYNMTTGEILWKYLPENVGYESPYGNYPERMGTIADGKIYLYTTEHSPTQPLYRGPNLRCVNATDGTEIWKILDYGGGIAIADGLLVKYNNFDNQIYCYGRGPSGTTVAASPEISVHGNSVMIKGTVTDQSPSGRRDTNGLIDFTLKGTPAISDKDMGPWMEYLFMQQAKPYAKGVEVSLTEIDPNGNIIEIGKVTSDMNGNYAIPFTPEVPGLHQIIANFQGSKAYGPSTATTYLSVSEAPPQPTAGPLLTLPPTEMYILGTGVAIIIAIAIIGVLMLLAIRKRP